MGELLEVYAPEQIVETGTFRGTTTRFFAEARPTTPIHTAELSPRAYGFARQNLRGLANVRLFRGDSRELLRALAENALTRGRRTLFYLDAHWGTALPIRGEIEIVFTAFLNAVVAIDDFRVPDDPGYGYDHPDQEHALTINSVNDLVERFSLRAFAPTLRSSEESGERRGLAILAPDDETVARLRSISTLRELLA